jgi:hypothetical protein
MSTPEMGKGPVMSAVTLRQILIGAGGFEPGTSWSRTKFLNLLRHADYFNLVCRYWLSVAAGGSYAEGIEKSVEVAFADGCR